MRKGTREEYGFVIDRNMMLDKGGSVFRTLSVEGNDRSALVMYSDVYQSLNDWIVYN